MPLYVDRINTCSILVSGSPILNLYQTGSGYNSTVRSGINSEAIGCYSVVSGGRCNTTIGCYSVVSGGRCNTTVARYSTITGGRDNQAGGYGIIDGWDSYSYSGSLNVGWVGPYSPTSASTINGNNAEISFYFNGGLGNIEIISGGSGYEDFDVLLFDGSLFPGGVSGIDDVTVTVYAGNFGYATVGGGRENTASGEYSTVSGGYENTTSAYASTIGGGANNTINSCSCYSTIGGGDDNTITQGYSSVISGGENNTTSADYSTVSGGYYNTTSGYASTISGGYYNTVSSSYGGILGGRCNSVDHTCSFIVGSDICSVANCTLHVNCLHFSSIPTSAVGLCAGTVWNDSGILKIA
jgi:hypothetical protein